MILAIIRKMSIVGVVLAPFGAVSSGVAQEAKSFPTYQAAATAMYEAARDKNQAELHALLGAHADSVLSSGDAASDENARATFVKQFRIKHAFTNESDNKVILTVGETAWPMPIPIVFSNGGWHFDSEEGVQELVYRRIGRNELSTLKGLKLVYLAEVNYAAKTHDGVPAGTYADKLVSSVGKHDGLYWVGENGQAEGPAGGLVALASDEGYSIQPQKEPFHGYFYKLLKEQGSHATGGARSYYKDGRMSAGFAVLAYPAEYGVSGIMTFIMGPHGTIYQKDLGEKTDGIAKAMNSYDPDSSWKQSRP